MDAIHKETINQLLSHMKMSVFVEMSHWWYQCRFYWRSQRYCVYV